MAELEGLHNSLLDRLLHYQGVLKQEGLDLPYPQAATEQDFVTLSPNE